VVLSLSCAELSAFYDTLETDDGFVALIDSGGTIMARGPVRPRGIGTRLSVLPTGAAASVSHTMIAPWDKPRSLISYRKLDQYPLAILVGMTERRGLARAFAYRPHFRVGADRRP
jgi:hypothetical protein